jgi:NADPH:quinone reductase-like Zn-dependent oxidoreductase
LETNIKTYKKLVAHRFNQDFESAIEIVEVPIPKPAASQLLIQNKFAGINSGFDTLLCQGKVPYVNLTPPFDLGVEAVGEVVDVGDDVYTFQVGDAVVTTLRGGGYREYQVIDANLAVKVRDATPEVLTLMPKAVKWSWLQRQQAEQVILQCSWQN